MYSNNAIKIQSFFIYLLPIFLVTGPFLPDSVVTLSSIFFLVFSILKKNYKYYDNLFFKFFLVFWIYISLNSIFSSNPLVSLKSSFFFIRFGIFSILVFYIIENNKNFIKYFSIFLFITFSIVLIDSYFQFFFGHNIIGIKSPQHDRLSSFFGEEMIVGSFLARLFPLIIAFGILMSSRGIKFLNIICIIFLVLTDIIIFLSGERTSFGLLVITNMFYIVFINKFKIFRIIGFSISIILIFLIINFNETSKNRMITQTLYDFNVLEKNSVTDEIDESNKKIPILNAFMPIHQSHYLTAINMFYKNKLFGVGPNMFRYECSNENYAKGDFNCTTHPHNIHIQILAETGILGYILFLFPFFYIIIYFMKNLFHIFKNKSNLNEYQTSVCIAFFLTMFPFAPSGNFFHNWLSIIYFLPVGFYLHAILRKNEY